MYRPQLLLIVDPAFTDSRPEDSLSSREPNSPLGLAFQVQMADQSLGRLQGPGHASISSGTFSSLPPCTFPRLAQVWCWAAVGAISMGRAAAGTEPFIYEPVSCPQLLLLLLFLAILTLLSPALAHGIVMSSSNITPRVGSLIEGSHGVLQSPPGPLGPDPQALRGIRLGRDTLG